MSEKGVPTPSTPEDEYFVRENAERMRRLTLEAKRAMAAEEQKRLRDLHYMHCPKCGMEMKEVHYGKLDVDACFSCGGVFLDKGEIDIIANPAQKGIMGAILNLFKDETQRSGK
ncbi:MAG TPA: zf-TFIIB domain-containing protein [Anaeromyxobacteraceae bacterium]|nr:zf-TFIIB domain-containing protein [Anaeromyxobacteraceae bacterium]